MLCLLRERSSRLSVTTLFTLSMTLITRSAKIWSPFTWDNSKTESETLTSKPMPLSTGKPLRPWLLMPIMEVVSPMVTIES
jgi:hypothetical protein